MHVAGDVLKIKPKQTLRKRNDPRPNCVLTQNMPYQTRTHQEMR